VAALLCLALALLGAVGHHRDRSADHLAPAPGQVAVRVELADGGADERFLRAGDRIDLIAGPGETDSPAATPAATADRIEGVRVLEVRSPPASGLTGGEHEAGTVLIVSADASRADLITSLASRRVLAARDNQP
jgi:hypothetical protein